MSEANINQLLELWAASQVDSNISAPFSNNDHLWNVIDNVELGHIQWKLFGVQYRGSFPAMNPPKWMTEEYEVWYRDPREIIHNILSNADFDGEFDYRPC